MNKKVILVIMDGWGLGKIKTADAIQNANTPFVNSLYSKYPHTTLTTFGEAVGLPEGQMGNSEVGHLNLGAGRIVYQELQRINVAIKTNEINTNPILLQSINYAKTNEKPLHLMGLVSDGGVHSHINHLKSILLICKENGLQHILIHAFTDGRDCDPKSGLGFLQDLQQFIETENIGQIATIIGRYYAMDRDKRWERVKLAYDALVNGIGEQSDDLLASIQKKYEEGITDEFIKPIINSNVVHSTSKIVNENDAVICFNFRTDRCREITQVLTQEDMPAYEMKTLPLYYTTLTEYNKNFKNINVVFETDNLNNTIGEVIAQAGLSQIRIAETEKYPHVTFFFSGGREKEFEGESRILVNSPKVATYDLQPQMSAPEITEKLLPEIENKTAHFVCLNYANADMVGHTGDFEAAKIAVETVDDCVKQVVTTGLQNGYTIFLTADHGNADFMINEDRTPNTAHTTNPVPLFIIDKNWNGEIKEGKLGDIAPTILTMMGLKIPNEMNGEVLI